MKTMEYFVVTQEKEIDEEMEEKYFISSEIAKVAKILYYIYKDEN